MTTQIFPLDADGAAADYAGLLGDKSGLRILDRTAWPRFGVKGPGSADWLDGAGIDLPGLNRLRMKNRLMTLRLGGNDIMLHPIDGTPDRVADLRGRWDKDNGPKGYSSWREEGWAWLYLDGPDLDDTLARCCAVDLRPAVFADDQIAQTSFAHVDAMVFRQDTGINVLFDISALGNVLATLRVDEVH